MQQSRRSWLRLAAAAMLGPAGEAADRQVLREFTLELPEVLPSYRFRAGVIDAPARLTVARFYLPHPISRLVKAGDVRVEFDDVPAKVTPGENSEALVIEAQPANGGPLNPGARLRLHLYVLNNTRFDHEWTLTYRDSGPLQARWGKTATGLPVTIRAEPAEPAAGQARVKGTASPAKAITSLTVGGVDAPVDQTKRTLEFDITAPAGPGGVLVEAKGADAGAVFVVPVE